MNKKLTALALTSALISCGGNVKDATPLACTGEDWEQIGYDTIMSGKPARDFNRYRDHCGDSLEDNAITLYQDGYVRGALEFCTEEKGYEYGSNGRDAPNVCPYELRHKFNAGYKIGDVERREKLAELNRMTDSADNADRLNETPKVPDDN